MRQKKKIGIIGCGQITRVRHAPELSNCEWAEPAGFYDLAAERAVDFATQYGGVAYSDYHNILQDPHVDGVIVCTSNNSHAQISIEAMKAGKAVLCEKPMATTMEDALEMANVAQKEKVLFSASHNQRFTFAHRMAKQLISSGKMGSVLSFRCTLGHPGPENFSVNRSNSTWYLKKETSGLGCVSDLGIHKIDVLMHIIGERFDQVAAFAGTRDKRDESGNLSEVYDNATCILKTPSGVLGTLNLLYTNYGDWDNSTLYFCENGTVHVHYDDAGHVRVIKKNGERIDYSPSYKPGETPRSGIVDAFAQAVFSGGTSPVPADEALHAMAAVFAVEEAVQSGTIVKIQID